MRLNVGCGTKHIRGYVSVDKSSFADVVCDIEREPLPYADDSIDEILAYDVLEHLDDLIFAMNEMWRVLKPDGLLRGTVPGTWTGSVADPTHRRIFVPETFDYFTGQSKEDPWRPRRPSHADYGIKPWYKVGVDENIKFALRPRKTAEYDASRERP